MALLSILAVVACSGSDSDDDGAGPVSDGGASGGDGGTSEGGTLADGGSACGVENAAKVIAVDG
ncbi:MAG: hypothetical protein ABI551_02600, partial [Polyangiaceae bacterium]